MLRCELFFVGYSFTDQSLIIKNVDLMTLSIIYETVSYQTFFFFKLLSFTCLSLCAFLMLNFWASEVEVLCSKVGGKAETASSLIQILLFTKSPCYNQFGLKN